MKPVTQHVLATIGVLLIGAVAAFALFAWSGVYNFAADEPHTPFVYSLLETMRERSIESRAPKVAMPDLGDETRIVQGAGNYNAMCVGCHLAPGMSETELSKGLYPAPPNLSKEKIGPEHAFWVIKHGIKASGMPAWGKSMSDEYVWNMAAFLQELPKLDADRYREMVARSGGHHHDHGADHDEDAGHDAHDHEHGGEAAQRAHEQGAGANTGRVHVHADGTQHRHTTQGERK